MLLQVLTVELCCEWVEEAGLHLSFIFAPVGGDILQNILFLFKRDVKELFCRSLVNSLTEAVTCPIRSRMDPHPVP